MARNPKEEAADNAAVVARLSEALTNPSLLDLSLRSDHDGTLTPAAAILLASCSPVFLKMLTGPFAEGANRGRKRANEGESAPTHSPAHTVSSAFSGDALSAVVAFSSTNDAPALWSGAPALLGEIMEAAEYYDIGGLRVKAGRRLMTRARAAPAEACAVLEAVWESWVAADFETGPPRDVFYKAWDSWVAADFGAGPPGEVAEVALAVIDREAHVALMGCGCLCEEAMERVLGSLRSRADEADLFIALQRWVSVDEEERRAGAGRLTSCLSFERMPPIFLSDVVAKSGLVSKEVLYDVFVARAVKSEKDDGFVACARVADACPLWCSNASVEYTSETKTHGVELLDRSLSNGCWAWDLRVERMRLSTNANNTSFWVGLASGDIDSKKWLGQQQYGYAYGNGGLVRHGRSSNSNGGDANAGPTFAEGDAIRVTVDCDKGTLSVKVNNGETFEAFNGIQHSGDRKAYRPAVSLNSPNRVRLLRFSRIQ